MEFTQVKQQLRFHPVQSFGKGATTADIQYAEKRLHVTLPTSYKQFLLEFGWGGIEDFEVFGVGQGCPKYLDVVKVTESERYEMEPSLKRDLVAILNDGFGNHYCLDTGKMSQGECPVVFWDHEAELTQTPEKVSKTFGDWLVSLVVDIAGELPEQ